MVKVGQSEKCVYRSRSKTDWETAKRFCEQDNAYLITFSSGDESLSYGVRLSSAGRSHVAMEFPCSDLQEKLQLVKPWFNFCRPERALIHLICP